jgi:hypothetical protein
MAEFFDDTDWLELIVAKSHKLEPDILFSAEYLSEYCDAGSNLLKDDC